MTRGTQASISSIMSRVRKKLAPMRSILFTKQMRGTLYLSPTPSGSGWLRIEAYRDSGASGHEQQTGHTRLTGPECRNPNCCCSYVNSRSLGPAGCVTNSGVECTCQPGATQSRSGAPRLPLHRTAPPRRPGHAALAPPVAPVGAEPCLHQYAPRPAARMKGGGYAPGRQLWMCTEHEHCIGAWLHWMQVEWSMA